MGAVEVQGLCRTFVTHTGLIRRKRTETEAVRGIDFSIGQGELFGLLGPNGAGKTTTIKMLVTLLTPTAGSARVLGFDVVRDSLAVRRRIGYVFGGERGLYDRLSAVDNLRYFAELYEVPAREQKKRIADLLDLVGLTGRENERVENYSRGMKQRLHVARGLLHDPQVLFLDEPTIGVDPVGARELRDIIGRLRDADKTVLLTTHYMFEADALCDRVAVIADGRIIAEGAPAKLKSQAQVGRIVEIETFGVSETVVERVKAANGVLSVVVEDQEQSQLLLVHLDGDGHEPGQGKMDQILACLAGERLGRISAREPSLEDAYISIVSEAGEGE